MNAVFEVIEALTGDRAKADEHLINATTMYREMDMGFWLEKAMAALEAAAP